MSARFGVLPGLAIVTMAACGSSATGDGPDGAANAADVTPASTDPTAPATDADTSARTAVASTAVVDRVTTPSTAAPTPTPTSATVTSDHTTTSVYVSPDGRFTLTYTEEPSEQVFTETAAEMPVEVVIGTIDGGAGFASCVPTDSAIDLGVESLLDEARDGALEQLAAEFVGERPVELQGRPGREFDATTLGGVLRARAFVDGDVVCEVVALVTEGGDGAAFLDSFQFLEEAA